MIEPRGPASSSRLRYAVDGTPSDGLTLGLSLQVVTLVLTGIEALLSTCGPRGSSGPRRCCARRGLLASGS